MKPPSPRICATCPWLKQNQRQKHPANWYGITNLKRLWNGLRSGKAPGMICHSSDPDSVHYGSVHTVHRETQKRPCAGAVILIVHHLNDLGASASYKDYRAHYKYPMSRGALAHFAWHLMTGFMSLPERYRENEVGLPWE